MGDDGGDQDARQFQTTTTAIIIIIKRDLPAKIDHIADHGCYTCQDLFRTIALGTAAVGVLIAPSPKRGD
jgi:isopentenyl diphosphate isomerase/L-lactate dehydrogenase-like FMN-dependent dehydrogenase